MADRQRMTKPFRKGRSGYEEGHPSVIAILGPSAVGKTAVGVALARLIGTSIVSCDSMQVYAGFPVLTNQPRSREDAGDLHELVGFVDGGRSFSVAQYAALARPLLASQIGSCGQALVVGGSGLYMRAALAPLQARKASDPGLRASLTERARREGAEALLAELMAVDPEAARSIDARNERRVVRALEVVLAGDGPWSGRDDLWEPAYDRPTMIVGLTMDRDELAARIAARASRIVDEGAVEEVRRFREERGKERTKPGNPGICSAIGYREIALLLDGEINRAEAVERIAAGTRKYARRQMTWLRKLRDAVMIDVRGRDPKELAEDILAVAGFRRSTEGS